MSPLSSILVEECTTHLLRATEQQTSGASQQFESLHPYYPMCRYRGMAKFDHCKALRITFDPRCATLRGSAGLKFYSDPDYKVELMEFSGSKRGAADHPISSNAGSNWKPFIIEMSSTLNSIQSTRAKTTVKNVPFLGWIEMHTGGISFCKADLWLAMEFRD